MAVQLIAPAWLISGMGWLVSKIGSKAGAIAVAMAINALVLATAYYLIMSLIPIVAMPPLVLRALSIVAPSDWAAQVALMMTIKSVSAVHRATITLYKAAA